MSSKRKKATRKKASTSLRASTAPVALSPAIAPRPAPANDAACAPSEEARPSLSSEERHRIIAQIAYAHAERAGFQNDPLQNWLLAEREVDADLARIAS